MNEQNASPYLDFEILVDQLNLPNHIPIPNLRILKNNFNQNELMDLFIEIFPNEIGSEKENQLRSIKNDKFEGTYVAVINNKIIGFLITAILTILEPEAYILYLGVLKKFRSKGIATALLQKFKEDLIHKEIPKIQAKVKKNNYLVLKYIKFLGFKQI
ncbi:MAG: GNAT family N-acetyltransferase [Candidatus Helarchaeota archaeon]